MRDGKLSGGNRDDKPVLPCLVSALFVGFFAEFVVQPAREKPAYPKHIDRRAEGSVAQPVLTPAKLPRPMVDRNLHPPIPPAFHQRRNEAAHPPTGQERAHALS